MAQATHFARSDAATTETVAVAGGHGHDQTTVDAERRQPIGRNFDFAVVVAPVLGSSAATRLCSAADLRRTSSPEAPPPVSVSTSSSEPDWILSRIASPPLQVAVWANELRTK
jgi:hypothetical protein